MDDRAVLSEYMEYLKDAGVWEHWGPKSFRWARGGESVEAAEDAAPPTAQEPAQEPLTTAFHTLEEVREYVGECVKCKLHNGRTHIVFGVGNPHAKLVFIGEGPGKDEDLQGEPFVGKAGQLLTDIIEKGMKLKRSDVYIANIVKCRPPDNRDPEEDEIAACEPYLLAQLGVIKPKIICTLGRPATHTLLKTKEPISKLRGNVFKYHDMILIPTFHPAYLLRNPADKALVWKDVQLIMKLYEGGTV